MDKYILPKIEMASPYANWSASVYYVIGDIVQYTTGSFYRAIVANIGVTPSASTPWSVYTPPGSGPTGATGPAGPAGSNGVTALNTKTGALSILGGTNVTIDNTSLSAITINATGGGGGVTNPMTSDLDGGGYSITNVLGSQILNLDARNITNTQAGGGPINFQNSITMGGAYSINAVTNLGTTNINGVAYPYPSGIYTCAPVSIQTIPITGLTAGGIVNLTVVYNGAGPIEFIVAYVPTTNQIDIEFSNVLSSDYKIVWSVAKF